MDRYEGEWTQREIYERAGIEPGEIAAPTWIARTLHGPGSVVYVRTAGYLGTISLVQESTIICVRAGMPTAITEWIVGHELSHWVRGTKCAGRVNDDEERLCDYVGAALQMPREAFQRRINELGRKPWRQLSLDFETTETSVVLRAGEVEERPLAVICPHRIYARGPEWFAWPDEDRLRAMARKGAPTVARARLRDDPRRVVIAPKVG